MLSPGGDIELAVKIVIPQHRFERLGWGLLDPFMVGLTSVGLGFFGPAGGSVQHNISIEVYVPEMCFNFPDILIEIRAHVELTGDREQTVNSILDFVTNHRLFKGEMMKEVRLHLKEGWEVRHFTAEFPASEPNENPWLVVTQANHGHVV